MIRRLVVIGALAFGLVVASAGGASAANVACAYNVNPLNIGVCLRV